MSKSRVAIPHNTKIDVLTEAGYRCAVPTCRTILAIDMHHIDQVSEEGSNEMSNLIALCPNCHRLYHKGEIPKEAIYTWKALLVSINQAFDKSTVDDLLFLSKLQTERKYLGITGDGVLKFNKLIASGLADFECMRQNGPLEIYEVRLSSKGLLLIDAWKKGDREAVRKSLESKGPEVNRS